MDWNFIWRHNFNAKHDGLKFFSEIRIFSIFGIGFESSHLARLRPYSEITENSSIFFLPFQLELDLEGIVKLCIGGMNSWLYQCWVQSLQHVVLGFPNQFSSNRKRTFEQQNHFYHLNIRLSLKSTPKRVQNGRS